MMYDGREYRVNHHLGCRIARDGDVYCKGAVTHSEGEPIDTNQMVVFRTKDAPMFTRDDQEYYLSSEVTSDKLLPMCAHTATNVALGPPCIKKVGKFKQLRMNVGRHNGKVLTDGQKYIEQAHYWCSGTTVHQWTSRRPVEQEDQV